MNSGDYCVLILSHGRPDGVITYKTLKKSGYTGKIYIVVDNKDETAGKYIKNFGKENVIIFDKSAAAKTFDVGDNFNEHRGVVYARNAAFNIAKELGYKYFVELDDDYSSFRFRKEKGDSLKSVNISNLDKVFDAFFEFLNTPTPHEIYTVAMAQGGDFIGGVTGGVWKNEFKRKAMNVFFLSVDKPFKVLGRINEDVNTYVRYGNTGALFFTIAKACVTQKQTQKNKGGLTEQYLDIGTYVKSFYTVMYCPSCVKISCMGPKHKRIHHAINWRYTVPQIVSEIYKK